MIVGHLSDQIQTFKFIINACHDIFFYVFFIKAGTEGFRNAFGTFSETNIETKYKNIVQNFVEKAIE